MTRRGSTAAALVLALAGAGLSAVLWSAHLDPESGLAAAVCGAEESDCGRALSSRFARFPPAPGGAAASGGVPVALLGLLYFAAIAVWLSLVGAPGERRAFLHGELLKLAGVGCAASLSLAVALLVERALCPLCLAAHACNLLLFVALLAARGARALDPEHPRPRLVAAAIALAAAAGLAAAQTGRAYERGLRAAALAAELGSLSDQAALLEATYLAEPGFAGDDGARARFDAALREDDPEIPAAPGLRSIAVVWSDAECTACRRFDSFLREVALPAFAGHLRVVQKHFPLDGVHPHATPAARAMEAARLQGAYFEYRARLLEAHDRLAEVDFDALAAELSLDGERFAADRRSESVAARVAADRALGEELGVDAAPTVFLDRRPLSPALRELTAFWELRAAALRRAREARGEGW